MVPGSTSNSTRVTGGGPDSARRLELEVRDLVAVERQGEPTAWKRRREERDAGQLLIRHTDAGTEHCVETEPGDGSREPPSLDERCGVAPAPELERHLRTRQLHETGRVGEDRSGIVRQTSEGARQRKAARAGV